MTHPHTHKEEPRSWEEEFEMFYDTLSFLPSPAREKVYNIRWSELKTFISCLLSTREKEGREEFLKKLPDEFIVHDYMEKQGDGLSKDYCEGWNDYRGEIIRRLSAKTEIR